MSSLKIIRTSRTQMSSLPSFKIVKSKPKEAEVRKREVTVVESGLGDVFKDLYEKPKAEVKPDEISEKPKEDEVKKEQVVVEESGLGDIFKDLYGESEIEVKTVSATLHEDEKPNTKEAEVSKEEVTVEESGLGDIFQDLYGESGTEVKPGEIPATSASKPHVRPDDEPEDRFPKQDEPPNKNRYYGMKVREGVVSTNAAEVESSDLDDLISQVMDIPADENPQLSSGPKPNTSTPSKDYEDDADFGDVLSLIRADDEGPEAPAGQANQRETEEDENRNRRSEGRDETSGKPMAYRDSTKPSPDGRSTITSTTSTISYSSKFVPNIPESFYKDMQSRLEDLIFKFECLDNEYAALQKISHIVHEETLEFKKKFSS